MTTLLKALLVGGATVALAACGGSINSQNGGGGGIFNPGTLSANAAKNYSQTAIATPNVPTPTTSALPGPFWNVGASATDATAGLVYIADKTNCGIDVYDAKANTYLSTIGPTTSPPTFNPANAKCSVIGSAFAGNTGSASTSGPNSFIQVSSTKAYAGDGSGTVKILNLTTRTVSGSITIPAAKLRAYEGSYDPDDNLVMIVNDKETAGALITFINASTDAVAGQIVRADATGIESSFYSTSMKKFVLAIPVTKANKNGEIDVIDPKALAVVNTIAMPGTCGPTGMAQGPQNRAVVACTDPGETYVMDVGSGQALATILQAGGGDGASWDPNTNYYWVANSNNTSTGVKGGPAAPVVSVIDANTSFLIQNIPTQVNAHTVATYNGRAFIPLPSQGMTVFQ